MRTWVNKHKETCHKPQSQDDEQARENRYRLKCHKARCNRKRIHSPFLKDRNCEMQEVQNNLDCARDAHVKPYLEQQNLGRICNSRAQSLNWDLWIGKRSPIRYRRSKIWQVKDPWWSKTSQGRHGIISWNLALICEVDHGIIEKSRSTPHRSKRFEISE